MRGGSALHLFTSLARATIHRSAGTEAPLTCFTRAGARSVVRQTQTVRFAEVLATARGRAVPGARLTGRANQTGVGVRLPGRGFELLRVSWGVVR